jgi:hypothetical protein
LRGSHDGEDVVSKSRQDVSGWENAGIGNEGRGVDCEGEEGKLERGESSERFKVNSSSLSLSSLDLHCLFTACRVCLAGGGDNVHGEGEGGGLSVHGWADTVVKEPEQNEAVQAPVCSWQWWQLGNIGSGGGSAQPPWHWVLKSQGGSRIEEFFGDHAGD